MSNIADFFKKNLGLIYSVGLIFVIPAVVFFFVFSALSRFEKNFNHLLQTKALLLEDVIAVFWQEKNLDLESMQEKIEQLLKENSDIAEIQVVDFQSGKEELRKIVASSNKNLIGEISKDEQDFWAAGIGEGIATLTNDGGTRFWKVAKKIQTADGHNLIVKISLSLREVDEVFQENITYTYWMLVLVSLILILLVTNYVRLSRYVFLFNKIKEVDQLKDDFISMASHELRTPLTAISGYVDLLSSSKNLVKEEKRYLENVKFSTERLKNLVNDILEVSRLEQNRVPFNPQETVLSEVIKKVIDNFQSSALEKKISLSWQNNSSKECLLFVDPARLEQILINLVGNAIKYTLQGEVVVTDFEKEGKVFLVVEDTGLGISAEGQKNLFTKFYRVKTSQTEKIVGTGLGLWITKQLVEKMKGDISVESIEGKGTKFIVSFPLLKK